MPSFDFLSRKKPRLGEQLAVLARCGISLNENFSAHQLAIRSDSEFFEKSPFTPLLCALGDESENKPHLPLSNNIWHLDTECVEGDGSYVHIAQRMELLAGGSLELKDLQDHVDIEEGKASLSFVLGGQKIAWTLKVNNDWLDERVLSNFAELLNRKNTPKRFTYFDLWGQDCLIGCATEEQLATLRKVTGLKFDWLK